MSCPRVVPSKRPHGLSCPRERPFPHATTPSPDAFRGLSCPSVHTSIHDLASARFVIPPPLPRRFSPTNLAKSAPSAPPFLLSATRNHAPRSRLPWTPRGAPVRAFPSRGSRGVEIPRQPSVPGRHVARPSAWQVLELRSVPRHRRCPSVQVLVRAGEVVPGAEFGEVFVQALGRAFLPQPRPQVLLQGSEEALDPSVLPRAERRRALVQRRREEKRCHPISRPPRRPRVALESRTRVRPPREGR